MQHHQESGLYFPDGDTHFTSVTKKGRPVYERYQHDRIDAALPWVSDFSAAVDGGAHVGLITRRLAELFDAVYAFEPHPDTYKCLVKNTEHLRNVICVNAALGDAEGEVALADGDRGNSGDRQVVTGTGVRQVMLDNCGLAGCGLIKLDVQGYEAHVLRGATKVLRAFSPVVLMEQEPEGKLKRVYGRHGAAQEFLKSLAAAKVAEVGHDQVWSFPPAGAEPYPKYAARGAYHWDKYEHAGAEAWLTELVDYIAEAAGLGAGPGHAADPAFRLLDVGCGDGLVAGLLARRGLSVVGVDNNPLAASLARRHGVDARRLSVYQLDAIGGQADGAVLFDVFEHLHFQDPAARRISACVRRDLYVLNPDPTGVGYHAGELSADALVELFARVGGWREKFRKPVQAGKAAKTFIHLVR